MQLGTNTAIIHLPFSSWLFLRPWTCTSKSGLMHEMCSTLVLMAHYQWCELCCVSFNLPTVSLLGLSLFWLSRVLLDLLYLPMTNRVHVTHAISNMLRSCSKATQTDQYSCSNSLPAGATYCLCDWLWVWLIRTPVVVALCSMWAAERNIRIKYWPTSVFHSPLSLPKRSHCDD